MAHDLAIGTTDWTVSRWDEEQVKWLTEKLGYEPKAAEFAAYKLKPYSENEVKGNLFTTAGLTRLIALLLAAGGQGITATSGRIGVGDGSGSAAVGDTDLGALSGATHRYFQPFDGAPSQTAGQFTVTATFASANGNFAWNEFGIDIGAPTVTGGTTVNATLFNHKTSIAQGTKVSGQSWAATATVTVA